MSTTPPCGVLVRSGRPVNRSWLARNFRVLVIHGYERRQSRLQKTDAAESLRPAESDVLYNNHLSVWE